MKIDVTEIQSGRAVEELFKTESGEVIHPVNAVFPIFQIRDKFTWIPLGTGFFINPFGVFATARHVLTDNDNVLLNSLVGVQVIRSNSNVLCAPRRIENVTLHHRADVAIGSLTDTVKGQNLPSENHALLLTADPPKIGDQIATYAIPEPSATLNEDGLIDLGFAPRLIYGEIKDHYPNGRDRNLSGHCYQTSMSFKGGASGGPVFCGNGEVFSLNSTAFEFLPSDDTSDEFCAVSFVSSITDLLDLDIHLPATLNGQPVEFRLPLKRITNHNQNPA